VKIIAGVLIAAALAFGSGCARSDWIERTLVTVDVTGTWYGRFQATGSTPDLFFELEQQGSTVKGFMRITGFAGPPGGVTSGRIDGTVAGDVFRFKDTRGNVHGEVTVSGDEMNGRASIGGDRAISLRRVESSSRPGSPPR
jgi:hypothetical protein